MRAAAICAALLASSSTARADLRIAIGNDFFTDVDPPIDDSGFTNDVAVHFWRPVRGDYRLGGALLHRWLTEVGGARRWDQLELSATLGRAWHLPAAVLVADARLGPVLGGNLGGRWIQDAYHRLTNLGPALDEGLQDAYPGDHRAGVFAGVRGEASVGSAMWRAYAALDVQLAVGETGMTYAEPAIGARWIFTGPRVELGAGVELATARYHTADANLTLPGGYATGSWEPALRGALHVAWSRFRIEYQLRANEGGSGEPLGIVAFTIAQYARRRPTAAPDPRAPARPELARSSSRSRHEP